MFTFEINIASRLIRSRIEGFLTVEDVIEWSRQEQAAVMKIGCGSGEFLLFLDTSGCQIQSQAVVSLFQHIIATSCYKAQRIAIMRGNSLTRMQTDRIVSGYAYIAHFDTVSAAEDWLLGNGVRTGIQGIAGDRLPGRSTDLRFKGSLHLEQPRGRF